MKLFEIIIATSILLAINTIDGDMNRSDNQQEVYKEEASLSFDDLQQVYLGSLKTIAGNLAKADKAKKKPYISPEFYDYVLKSYNEIDSYLTNKQLFISFIEDYCRTLKAKENLPAVLPPREYQTENDRNFIDKFILVEEFLKGEPAFDVLGDIITYMEGAARNYPSLQPLVDRLESMRTTIVTQASVVVGHTSNGIDTVLEKKEIQDRQPKMTAGQDVETVEKALQLELKQQYHNSPITLKEQELEKIDRKQDEKEREKLDKLVDEKDTQQRNSNAHVLDKKSPFLCIRTRLFKKTRCHEKKGSFVKGKHRSTKYSHSERFVRHPIAKSQTNISSDNSHRSENKSLKNHTVFQRSLTHLSGTESYAQHLNGCFNITTVGQYEGMVQIYVNFDDVSNILNGTCYRKVNVKQIEIICVDNICQMKITNYSDISSDDSVEHQDWYKHLAMVTWSVVSFFVAVYSYVNFRAASDRSRPSSIRPARNEETGDRSGYVEESRQPRTSRSLGSSRNFPNY